MKCIIVLSLIGLIALGGYKGIQHLFIGNEKYRLDNIDLSTNGHLDVSRVVKIASIDINTSIFAINTDQVSDNLQALPEVVECSVERRLPGTLRINITERVPVAWLESASLGFPGRNNKGILADKNGITFPCEGSLWTAARDLPVIVINKAKSEAFHHGHKMKHPEVMRALHLLEIFSSQNPRAEWSAERVIIVNDYSIRAVCNDGSLATFGMYNHDRQLADFITIREHTLKSNRSVTSINLIPNKNIPVQFTDDAILIKPRLRPQLINPNQRKIQSILNRN